MKKHILSFVLASSFLLQACSADVTDEEYISRAQAYMNGQQYSAAIIELKNALLENPENGEARLLLGRAYLNSTNPSGAEKEFIRAGELGVPESRYLADLSKAYLDQGKITDILGLELSDKLSDEERAALHASRGYAFVSIKQIQRASDEFEKSLDLNPKSPYAKVGKAGFFASQKQFDLAFKELEQALAMDQNYSQAWSYKGSLEKHQGKLAEAIKSYSKAIEVNTSNDRARLKRSMLLVQTGDLERAEKELADLGKRYKDSPDVNYTRGLLFFKQKKIRDAQVALEQVLGVAENHLQARFLLGQVHLLQGNLDVAESIVSQVVADHPGWLLAKKLLAMIALRQQEPEKAVNLLQQVVRQEPDNLFSLNLLADALLRVGRENEALEKLNRVVELDPDSAQYRMRLGAGLLQTGDEDAGLVQLEQALQMNPALQAVDWVKVRAYLREGKLDDAEKAAQSYAEREPNSALPQNLLGMVFIAKKDISKATVSFRSAREKDKSNLFANQNLSSLALLDQQPEQAKRYLMDILEQRPSDLGTLMKLAAIEGYLNNDQERRRILTDLIRQYPESIAPHLELAGDYLKEGNLDAARRELGSIGSQDSDTPAYLLLSGKLYLASGEFFKAEHALQKLTTQQPRMVEAHYLLAKAYASLDRKSDYRASLDKVLELAPEYDPANRAMLRLLIMEQSDLSAAKRRIDQLRADGILDDSYLQLEGLYYEKLGNREQALQRYREWVEKSDTDQALIELARFQWRNGGAELAVEVLEAWDNEHPERLPVMLELANAYLGAGAGDQAAIKYKQILQVSENNLIALNNLAWYLMESSPSEALGYAEQAYKVSPETATVVDTLAMALLAEGALERALRLIDQALEMDPGNPSYIYHKAKILEQSNQRFDAMSVLSNLEGLDRAFPEKKQAQQMLNRLRSN